MSANSLFPFALHHKCGHIPVICNRAVVKKVPLGQRNFYLDSPSSVLLVIFANSSPQQLVGHFKAMQQLVLNYPLCANKRHSLIRLLRHLKSLGVQF